MSADQSKQPHPRWRPGDKSARHPQTVEEWDILNDPPGEGLDRARRRLNVAIDYADPRAPDQMAIVSRSDLSRLMHDWHHKNAVFEIWRDERAAITLEPAAESASANPK